MNKKIIPCTVALLAIAASPCVTSAETGHQFPQVGIVEYPNAPLDRYLLLRSNKIERFEVATPLQENDVLWIGCKRSKDVDSNSESIQVTLRLADVEEILGCESSPYHLKGKKPLSRLRNLYAWAGEAISMLAELHPKKYSLIVRGGDSPPNSGRSLPLYIPLIGRAGGRVVEGRRDLYLAWVGGLPPYHLELAIENQEDSLIERKGLGEAKATITGLDLPRGKYELKITDAGGRVLTRRLQAVALSALPVPEHEAFANPQDPRLEHLHETAYASWLSNQDRGVWSLEAYQRVMNVVPESYLAKLLRLKLEGAL